LHTLSKGIAHWTIPDLSDPGQGKLDFSATRPGHSNPLSGLCAPTISLFVVAASLTAWLLKALAWPPTGWT